MSMDTNLHGRLRNTSLPAGSGLMPLYEAVVNSIHAIEEGKIPPARGKIKVSIFRGSQKSLDVLDDSHCEGAVSKEPIIGFKIIDNGIGFNDDNMASFRTLDTEHKVEKGGGVLADYFGLKPLSV